jgi:hypothetical protein
MDELERLPHDPTQEQIAAMTAVIRSKWTEHERRKRMAWAVTPPVEVPEVEFDDDTPVEW